MVYVGSAYYNRVWRRNGWGDFFGIGLDHQGRTWEAWFALFGRTFWIGVQPQRGLG